MYEDELRDLERTSIRAFMESCGGMFARKRVLDYGCGLQPYRDIVERVQGEYTGFDRADHPGSLVFADVGDRDPLGQEWDFIVCNQVIQYVPDVSGFLRGFYDALGDWGVLILTGPTNWPEVEPWDLHRHTRKGIERLLREAGFRGVEVKSRASWRIDGRNEFSLGYGAVARK